MMRYSTEDEKDYQEFLKKEEVNVRPACKFCRAWTNNEEHSYCFCYMGNCPALIRDIKEKNNTMSKV